MPQQTPTGPFLVCRQNGRSGNKHKKWKCINVGGREVELHDSFNVTSHQAIGLSNKIEPSILLDPWNDGNTSFYS